MTTSTFLVGLPAFVRGEDCFRGGLVYDSEVAGNGTEEQLRFGGDIRSQGWCAARDAYHLTDDDDCEAVAQLNVWRFCSDMHHHAEERGGTAHCQLMLLGQQH